MAAKDDPKVQRDRIRRILAEMDASYVVDFDPDSAPSWIRFRIEHGPTRTTFVSSSGDWQASEIGDKSDNELRKLISSLSGGKIR